jgi:hypothetical protein
MDYDVSIRTICAVERKLDRFNGFLRGDSRDKAMADFFEKEVWPALAVAAGNYHFMGGNPDRYDLADLDLQAYELAARVSDGLCCRVAPATKPWRRVSTGWDLGLALGSIVTGVGGEDLGRHFSVEFMLGEIGEFAYGGRPTRGDKAISLIADALRQTPDPDDELGRSSGRRSSECETEYVRPLVVYSRLAYARMQRLRDMLKKDNLKKELNRILESAYDY